MSGNTTYITKPDNKNDSKPFTFDYSYWSHDCYREEKNGYLAATGSEYADQRKVFDDLGRGVLDNAWQGYNCSLFAYGQTGSGKSYSMVGYGANKGIVPIVCEELFKAKELKEKTVQKGEELQVKFSMLEIYNEQVRDLLNNKSQKSKTGLKVRMDKNKGFYAEGLEIHPVSSYKDITIKMDQGTKNRSVAATNMNATSSRAHTIVAIHFTQKIITNGRNMTKTAIINLVDLAGSERATSTKATGDRLKEGSLINQSLSNLGNCIKALADESMGKKNVIVPYRDSMLTKLLRNALGGNSKTIMIAALSPAHVNYDETLSTLKFADRAKAIKTKATVNESPTDKIIRELREENERLQKMLKAGGPVTKGSATSEDMSEMEEELRKNQEEMENMQKSWEQILAEKEKEFNSIREEDKKKQEQQKSLPHLWNLNEDPALTHKIIHFIPTGKCMIGREGGGKKPDIGLIGLSIQPEHATTINEKNTKVFLKPARDAKVLLNGNQIKDKKELHHNDRIMLGNNLLFVLHHPLDLTKQQKNKKVTDEPTFDTAQQEIAQKSGIAALAGGGAGKPKADPLLLEDLVHMFPMVNECNAMSEELNKKVHFEVTIVAPQTRGVKDGRSEVCCKVKNLVTNNEWLWDRSTFLNRKFLMQEMYQNFMNGENDWDKSQEEDPFWEDPKMPVLIGTGTLYLQSLAYKVEIEDTFPINDHRATPQGNLKIRLYPCMQNGKIIDDAIVDDENDMVGHRLYYRLAIENARGIPKRFVQTFCKYKLYLDDEYTQTEEKKGMNPDFNYEKQYEANPVTHQFWEYLSEEALWIEVWGRQQEDPSALGSDLTTKELMLKESAMGGVNSAGNQGNTSDEEELAEMQNKMSVEATTYRRRTERAEVKLAKLQALCEASKKGNKIIKVDDVEKILHHGHRFKATANVVVMAKQAEMGQASQACTIQ